MPDAPANLQHGFIQKSLNDALKLRYTIRDTGDMFQFWLLDGAEWNYVGRLTSKRFIVAILMDQLGQEEV